MTVALSARSSLQRILRIIDLTKESEQPALFIALRALLSGSNGGSSQVHEPGHDPTLTRDEPRSDPAMNHALDHVVVSTSFDSFWELYPKKVGKQEAKRIYLKLKPDQELQELIVKALLEQKASEDWLKDDGQFIPHPKTWLNQRRWEDEPRMTRPKFGRTDPMVYQRFIEADQ